MVVDTENAESVRFSLAREDRNESLHMGLEADHVVFELGGWVGSSAGCDPEAVQLFPQNKDEAQVLVRWLGMAQEHMKSLAERLPE